MKTTKYFLFAIMLLFTSCADDSDPGPKGDTGATGAQGDPGPQGEQGPQGEPGTANVLYSEWMKFDWNVFDDPDFKQLEVEEPAITEAFLNDGGIMLVYVRVSSPEITTAIIPLPHYNASERMVFATMVLDEPYAPYTIQNGFIISVNSEDGDPVSDFQDTGSTEYDFRYILIPGGTPISSTGRWAPSVDYSNYEAVKQYFNIPE